MADDKNEDKTSKPWRFQPGNPGGPGRPRGQSLKEFAREYLKNLPDDRKTAYLATLPKEVVWKMAEGNPSNELTGKDGGEVVFKVVNYGNTDSPPV